MVYSCDILQPRSDFSYLHHSDGLYDFSLGCDLAALTMTRSSEPKPGHVPKRLGPHDLVTRVPGFENQVFHLVLGPGHQSLTNGGKSTNFAQVFF